MLSNRLISVSRKISGKSHQLRKISHTAPCLNFSKFEAVYENGKLEKPEAYSGYNGYYKNDQCKPHKRGDVDKKAYTYLALAGARFTYASMGRFIVLKVAGTMSASADVLAMSSLEVDLSVLSPGTSITVKWRGKPVFIRRRTAAEIASAKDVDVSSLRDPQSDTDRVTNPEWLVVLGVCTHLGCVPLGEAGDFGGWFCPCHGSHYDTSGRIRKGPAPLNLEVPQYKFLSEDRVLLG